MSIWAVPGEGLVVGYAADAEAALRFFFMRIVSMP